MCDGLDLDYDELRRIVYNDSRLLSIGEILADVIEGMNELSIAM